MRTAFALAAGVALTLTACGTGESVAETAATGNRAVLPPSDPSSAGDGGNLAAVPDDIQAAPQAATRLAWSPTGYRLVGTEPFWGGIVGSEAILYSTLEDQSGQSVPVEASHEEGREVYTGRLRDRPFILVLTDGPCSDGMSDNVHRFTATLQVDDETRRGCANPA